jgi:hypothetical protein
MLIFLKQDVRSKLSFSQKILTHIGFIFWQIVKKNYFLDKIYLRKSVGKSWFFWIFSCFSTFFWWYLSETSLVVEWPKYGAEILEKSWEIWNWWMVKCLNNLHKFMKLWLRFGAYYYLFRPKTTDNRQQKISAWTGNNKLRNVAIIS